MKKFFACLWRQCLEISGWQRKLLPQMHNRTLWGCFNSEFNHRNWIFWRNIFQCNIIANFLSKFDAVEQLETPFFLFFSLIYRVFLINKDKYPQFTSVWLSFNGQVCWDVCVRIRVTQGGTSQTKQSRVLKKTCSAVYKEAVMFLIKCSRDALENTAITISVHDLSRLFSISFNFSHSSTTLLISEISSTLLWKKGVDGF